MSITYRASWLLGWIRYGRYFASYPISSRVLRPEMLSGTEGISIGRGSLIMPHARLECVWHEGERGRLVIGNSCCINPYFHCGAAIQVTIGDRVTIASRVYITDHDHGMPMESGRLISKPVHIGAGCWLGEGCAILKGVTLGEGCVVGTNAVVTKSAPPIPY